MRLIVSAIAALLIGGGAAQAACNAAGLKGNWTLNQTNLRQTCAIQVEADGDFTGTCRFYNSDQEVSDAFSAKGTIKYRDGEGCEFKGQIRFDGETRSFGGVTDTRPAMLTGVVFKRGGLIGYKDL